MLPCVSGAWRWVASIRASFSNGGSAGVFEPSSVFAKQSQSTLLLVLRWFAHFPCPTTRLFIWVNEVYSWSSSFSPGDVLEKRGCDLKVLYALLKSCRCMISASRNWDSLVINWGLISLAGACKSCPIKPQTAQSRASFHGEGKTQWHSGTVAEFSLRNSPSLRSEKQWAHCPLPLKKCANLCSLRAGFLIVSAVAGNTKSRTETYSHA